MAAKHPFTVMLTVTLLLMCTGFTTSATRCPNCGTTQIPYPLSTGPSCGDQSYKVRCQTGTRSLFFDTLNYTYPIKSISQTTQRFVIQPSNFLNSNTCVTADVSSQGLQLDPTLPFNIGSGNTIMYLNCSVSLLRSPLDCASTLCHSYINNSVEASSCSQAPICCVYRPDRSSTAQYSIRVRDGGCQAYRSFPNLDYSLPLSRWPAPGVEIQWMSPPEPLCRSQTDCDASSTCLLSSGGAVRRCLCNTGLHWDAINIVCTLDNTCENRGDCSDSNRTALIAALGGAGVVMILIIIILCIRKKYRWRKKADSNVNVEIFLKNQDFLAPKRYSYSKIKKMTNSFEVKLGQGGFGSVYRGELSGGNLVAVKILSEVKGNGKDFVNEVASVGRTCHVNIVSLVGFCLEGRRRALIYEFMPNGSLEKFIYDGGSSNNSHLGWDKLHQIAIGIARGLEYLHRHCNTRILHFDIKPHNILLDQNMCPKISDFGLAKSFPNERSKISMSHMRGTPGYIAPEMFSRNFGEVSNKSDVYSYGMMILEMFNGRKNNEVEVDQTSEMYFPHAIYKRIELNEEQLGLHGIVSDEENNMVRKTIIVGLWCIQTNPLNRPTITRVLEMLEGDLELLEIPPKPYLSSPSRPVNSRSPSTSFPLTD